MIPVETVAPPLKVESVSVSGKNKKCIAHSEQPLRCFVSVSVKYLTQSGEPSKAKFDGLVKSPSAALRFNFVVAAHLYVRLTPQFLRALQLELFTKPSFS